MLTLEQTHLRFKYRWAGHEGFGMVDTHGEAGKHNQGVLVIDAMSDTPIPWFEARMEDIEILEIEPEARELLHRAGYRLPGL